MKQSSIDQLSEDQPTDAEHLETDSEEKARAEREAREQLEFERFKWL